MKKITKFLSVCAMVTLTSSAFAQAQNFEGFSVHASTGYNSWKSGLSNYITGGVPVTAATFDSVEGGGTPLFLGLEYTLPIDKEFTFGISWETDMLDGKTGTGALNFNGVKLGDYTHVVKSGAYQISLKPGVVMAPNTLLYGKFGYFSLTNTIGAVGETPLSYTSTGYGLGAGLKQMLSKNIFGFGEFSTRIGTTKNHTPDAGQTIDLKVDGMSALVGVGVKF